MGEGFWIETRGFPVSSSSSADPLAPNMAPIGPGNFVNSIGKDQLVRFAFFQAFQRFGEPLSTQNRGLRRTLGRKDFRPSRGPDE